MTMMSFKTSHRSNLLIHKDVSLSLSLVISLSLSLSSQFHLRFHVLFPSTVPLKVDTRLPSFPLPFSISPDNDNGAEDKLAKLTHNFPAKFRCNFLFTLLTRIFFCSHSLVVFRANKSLSYEKSSTSGQCFERVNGRICSLSSLMRTFEIPQIILNYSINLSFCLFVCRSVRPSVDLQAISAGCDL